MTKSQVTFYGGTGAVTGANFLFETAGKKIIIDCGLVQGQKHCTMCNYDPFPYDPGSLDAVLVTHGHLDHVGRLPKLVHEGFSKTIYSTPITKRLARLILEDGARIMNREARESGRSALYTQRDVENTMSHWETIDYHTPFMLGDDLKVVFKDAGHILGSAMIEIVLDESEQKKIVFTGDLGNSPAPLLQDTEAITDATYLVMESVYGDRNHEDAEERVRILERIIENVIKDKGVLMIPAFSIERTQALLYDINTLVEAKDIPRIPVFLDSPLAIKVTELYKEAHSVLHFNEKTRHIIASGDDIFAFPGLKFTQTRDESKTINHRDPPKIIIAGSGMSTGGRILHHERRYLKDPKNTILFVGYQAAGSLGRQILDGAHVVEINEEKVPVRAHVEKLFSYSAHKDSDGLLEFVDESAETLKRVFVVMGEPSASMFLAQRIRDYIGVDAIAPKEGQTIVLS